MSDAASAATDSNLLFDQIEKRASLQKLYVLSARSTFPNLENFRIAELQGFRRVFAHSAPIFFERGIANPETKEISSLSVEPCEGERLVVTVFEIKSSEIPAFIQRELEFRFSLLFLKQWKANLTPIMRYSVVDTVMRSFSRLDAKETKRFTFNIMEDTTSTRYGEMTSYLVVSI